jgi:hypothetical protein
MFKRSRPVAFKPVPYQRARAPFRIPGWFLTLLVGMALGVGGVLYVQATYLPRTLSVEESQRLIGELAEANQQRERLAAELVITGDQLQSARAERDKLGIELAATGERLAGAQNQILGFFQALPPDPRGGAIGVRSARFELDNTRLTYNALFTDDRSRQQAFAGVMQLSVVGRRASGGEEAIVFDPVPLAVDPYQHLQGEVTLPGGFAPSQATLRVLERAGGPQVSMRVYNVR